MTKASELLALADRCEAATAEQQRELLEQAFYAIHGSPLDADRLTDEQTRVWAAREGRFFSMLRAEAYESAAMTLADGMGGEVTFFKDGTAKAFLWQPYPMAIDAKAATPALALCAAALRSIASKESEDHA